MYYPITLNDLIGKLKRCEKFNQYNEDEIEKEVYFDFGKNYPLDIDSWRGSYSELALNYNTTGKEPLKISEFIELLEQCIGRSFEGYKGGNFKMHSETEIYVANYGGSENMLVFDVIDDYYIILETRYRV